MKVLKVNESKTNKLSQSALGMYLTCGAKYKFHYQNRLRSKVISGALLFGGAIDKALNELLTSRNLESAIKTFDQEWEYGWINNKKIYLPESELIVYAKKDFDSELLLEEDEFKLKDLMIKLDYNEPELNLYQIYNKILELKEEKGFENLTIITKKYYNLVNWLCLKRKAHLMLKAYNEKVLPKIKKVLAVQKEFNLVGKTGDIIPGWIDLIVEWEDGKHYVLDNKTSSMEYESDSASKSKQLILYFYAENKERSANSEKLLDGMGFAVMSKQIQKNRIKICEKCGHNGTGGRHKTCDNEIIYHDFNKRCNGAWKETISPECKIDIILNQITQPAQNLIIKSFQGANEGIKAGIFPPNPDACMSFGNPCQFYNLCWKGEDKDLIQLEEKKVDDFSWLPKK